ACLTNEQNQDIKEARLADERNRKRRKLALETNEEREARLARK
ncbi:10782_t:CDS:1, partial [Acaulospora morrowiae]